MFRRRLILSLTAAAVLLAFMVVVPGNARARKLKVVATLPDLASIARAVGGEHVDVSSIALGTQDPHYVEAKPSFQVRLSRADLLIYNGLELEVGWLPLLVQGSRNPKILAGASGSLNASNALDKVLEVPTGEVDRSMGDIHPLGNPHYLLNPRNGIKVAALIRDRLKKLDPGNAGDYDANYAGFEQTMNSKIEEWEKRAASIQGAKIVVYHKQWEYLVDWLGLEIVAQVENKPGIPPSPRHRAHVIKLMKEREIRAILAANFSPGLHKAEKMAKETGAAMLELPASVEGEPGIKEYDDLFDRLVSELVSALGG